MFRDHKQTSESSRPNQSESVRIVHRKDLIEKLDAMTFVHALSALFKNCCLKSADTTEQGEITSFRE